MIQTVPLSGIDPLQVAKPEEWLDAMGLLMVSEEVVVAGAVVVVVVGIVAWLRRRRAAWSQHSGGLPQVIFPITGGAQPAADPLPGPPSHPLDDPPAGGEDPLAPPPGSTGARSPEPSGDRRDPPRGSPAPPTAPSAAPSADGGGPAAPPGGAMGPSTAPSADGGPRSSSPVRPAASSGAPSADGPASSEQPPAQQPQSPAESPPTGAAEPLPDAVPHSVGSGAADAAAWEADGTGRDWVSAGPVRFERPPEGTLQLLPGRLEIESRQGRGEEIRFIRAPGSPPEITFGRNSGPQYRHVQLRVATVSRLHAHLRFEDGVWTIRNLSETNPTVVNGRSLALGLQETSLQDGDRIEMGEVVFTFRQPDPGDRLPFRSSWYTDRGQRPTNQDAVVIRTLPASRELAAVCDGMGSHEAGGEASWMAIEALVEACQDGQDLTSAVQRANAAIRAAVDGAPEREGMGTTLVAALREDDRYSIANVGDSRAYRIDADGIRQLTRDHSFLAEAREEGGMSAEEAARSPWRRGVTRNLGAAADVEVDVFGDFSALEPHVLVLCSDGIHDVLEPEEVARVVRRAPHIRDVARLLCEEAIRKEGEDNVAAAALAFGGGMTGHELKHT